MRYPFLALLSVLLVPHTSYASTLLISDNFDSYNPGQLNKNGAGSPNSAPNGTGNPWWGPFGGRLTQSTVVGPETGVTPHSGTQMVAGASANNTQSELWQNIAYRYNGGDLFSGDLALSFWFYDPIGTSNGIHFAGTGGIAYYNTNSPTADYPSSQTLNSSSTIDRLSIGGAPYTNNTAGFPQTYNSTQYQARVVGSSLGYTTNGWINLPITRSVGWHEAQILVGPANPDGTNPVSFYIDDLNTPLLTATSVIAKGFSVLELCSGPDQSSSSVNAGTYFDDVTLTATPEPTVLALLPAASLLCLRRDQNRRTCK
jgi:hypothetical protein